MKNTAPHYLLITEAKTIIDPREDEQAPSRRSGRWRFVLEQMGVDARIEVADDEPNVTGERLELLAVVRGLESLEQPSRVTLLTSSRYVGRGIRQGMSQWRSNHWRWERFGKMTLIKNHDLWRRVDHALKYHSLECRIWDLSRLAPHTTAASTKRSFETLGSPSVGNVDHHRRRTNVIRPHGDDLATDRKPIAPVDFSGRTSPTHRNTAAKSRPNIIVVRNTGSSTAETSELESWAEETPPPAPRTQCKKHQHTDCVPPTNMACVKPPRAGRAYGYAVN